jgi:hypothetical protein
MNPPRRVFKVHDRQAETQVELVEVRVAVCEDSSNQTVTLYRSRLAYNVIT